MAAAGESTALPDEPEARQSEEPAGRGSRRAPRAHRGLWLILACSLVPLASLIVEGPALAATTIVALVQTLVTALVLLRLSASRSPTVRELLLALALLCALAAVLGIATADPVSASLLLVVIALLAANLFPWGLLPQVFTVGFGALALIATLSAVEGGVERLGHGGLAGVAIAFAASLYVGRERERGRIRTTSDERDRARERQALRLVESALGQANDAVVVLTASRGLVGPRIVFVNPAFTRLTGFSATEALGCSLRAVLTPAGSSDAMDRLYGALREARPAVGEGTFRRRDGSLYMIEWNIVPVRSAAGQIANWVAIARDVTERTRAERARAALLEVARSISGEIDLDQILENVQRQIATLLPCDRVATFLWDEFSHSLTLASAYGFAAGVEAQLASRYQAGDLLREHWLGGETIVVDPPRGEALVSRDVLARLGVAAVVGVPLQARGRMVGVLLAANSGDGPRFDSDQIQLFEGIARQVALAIDSAELFQAQREDASVSSALARVGQEVISSLSTPVLLARLCQLTTEVLACDSSHTFLWHPDQGAYLPVSQHGDTAEEWERLRARAMRPQDFPGLFARLRRDDLLQLVSRAGIPLDPGTQVFAEAGLASTLCVALRRGQELIGYQAAHVRQPEYAFTRQQERIARGIGYLGSMALENARLVEELERANRAKSDFVATVSHELRTPLNVILGYNELLLSGEYGELAAEQTEPLERVDRNARELLELIDATLELSRLERQIPPLNIAEVEIVPLVEEVARETAAVAEKTQVELRFALASDLPRLRTDAVKLRMVLKNLLANAFKFTHAGSVTVSARSAGSGVEVAVSDTGIGMDEAALKIIFQPFRQLDSSDTRRYRGVGLGLHIVDRLLGTLGGEISVSSKPGAGSTFRVWLPLDPEASNRARSLELLATEHRTFRAGES